jgi:hypothetical protein
VAGRLKTASFTVHADVRQSAAWKRMADAEGFPSVGMWISQALDRYLEALRKAGKPVPLAWARFGRFRVHLQDGREIEVPGRLSPPFGIFRGDAISGPGVQACGRHTLVYAPTGRVIATLPTERACKSLAGDLSRVWVRWGGKEPEEDPAPILSRL